MQTNRINAKVDIEIKIKGQTNALLLKQNFQDYVNDALKRHNTAMTEKLENDKILDEES